MVKVPTGFCDTFVKNDPNRFADGFLLVLTPVIEDEKYGMLIVSSFSRVILYIEFVERKFI